MEKRAGAVALLAVLVGLATGCADRETASALAELKAQADLEARNIEVIKTLLAELDKGNAEIILKLYSPDAKYYFPSGSPKPISREDETAQAKMFLKALPDITHEVIDIFAVKDKVVLRSVARGTHRAELEGIPPTGNKIAISNTIIFRIKDGLVVEEAEDADMLGFYQQIGMELKPKAAAKPAASKTR
jgi:predicted ester cyclase